MAMTNTTSLVKFIQLEHVLNIPGPYILGHLQYLWNYGHMNAKDRRGPLFRRGEVEAVCRWQGLANDLENALLACQWLDSDGDFLFIHDFWEHAPQFTHRRIERIEKKMASQSEEKTQKTVSMASQLQTKLQNSTPMAYVEKEKEYEKEMEVINTDPPNPPSGGTPIGAACEALSRGMDFLLHLPAVPHGPNGEPLTRDQLAGIAESVRREIATECEADPGGIFALNGTTAAEALEKHLGPFHKPPESPGGVLPGMEAGEAPVVAPAPRTPQSDPLAGLPTLADYHETARAKIQRNHPTAKQPLPGTPGWFAERVELEKIHRLDDYAEDVIVKTLEWVFDAAPRANGFCWTDQVASLAQLRNKRKGDTQTKFDKVYAASCHKKPSVVAQGMRRESDYDAQGRFRG